MADFWAKRYDTAPPLREVLVDGNGDPANLQNTSVRFFMKPMEGYTAPAVEGDALVEQFGDGLDGTMGRVSYQWAPNDLDIPGGYYAEWQVTYADGHIETFPNDRYVTVAVVEDLGQVTGS